MSEPAPMDCTRIEVSALQLQGIDSAVRDASPADRIAMVWQLTRDAWSFKEPTIAESRLQRHVVRVTEANAEYLVVGAYALAAQGFPRKELKELASPPPAKHDE